MNDSSRLDRSIPEGAREEWALRLATPPEDKSGISTVRLFLFRAGEEWFAIDPSVLSSTLPYTRPRRLPHQRTGLIEGLVNADGRVIICVSLPRFAGGQASAKPEDRRWLLVCSWQKFTFAFAAEEVLGVEDIDTANLAPLPSSANSALQHCSRGIARHAGRAVTCLEAEAFCRKTLEALQ